MKKTIVKAKLVLRKESIKALSDKDITRVGAGQGANLDVTHPNGGCPDAAVIPGRS